MRRALLIAAGAGLLSLGSSKVERRGPDLAFFCAIGPPEETTNCPKPRLNGGWPAPFLFDTPGVSIEWQLAFVEDEFRVAPFAATFAFHALMLGGIFSLARRLRRVR